MTNPAPRLNLAAALLLAGLISSLTAILSEVAVRVFPFWRPGYLVAACAIVALESALIRYRMLRDRELIASGLRYLAAEIFTLVVLMRVVATLSRGLEQLPATARLWLRSPLAAFDDSFLVCLLVGLLAGLLVRSAMVEISELEPHGQSRPPDQTIDTDVFRAAIAARQQQALTRISTGLAWGGAAALVGLVGQVVDISRINGPPLALSPMSGVAGIVYLLCAMTLYSQTRLGLLRARWHMDGSEVDPAVQRIWGRSSATLIICVTLLSLFLPNSYGMSLLDTMRGSGILALNILALVMVNIGLLLITLLGLLLSIPAILLAMLGLGSQGPASPAPSLPTPLPLPPTPPIARDPPLLPALIFWACVAVLAGYALWIVARRQGWARRLAESARSGGLARLWAALRDLWRGARGYAQKVGEVIAEQASYQAAEQARRLMRLQARSPGDLVRYFYISTLRRAAARGVGRRHAQAPREYEAQLRAHLPEAAADIAELTDAYVAAAYAPRPTLPDEARRARQPWERLRRLLRRREE